nr:MAG TPA: hypothetical protein [Caudoviricetes sp.]
MLDIQNMHYKNQWVKVSFTTIFIPVSSGLS